MLAVFQYLLPIYKDMHHARSKLLWLVERRIVSNTEGVENDDISKIADTQSAAFRQMQIVGRQSGEFSDGFCRK